MSPILLLCLFLMFPATTGSVIHCQAQNPARYALQFLAEWNSFSFPKQYPTYRPPAQWSMLFGCVHSYDFTLWAEGAMASFGVKMFAEDGKPELLLEEVNATQGVVHGCFHSNPITAGEGNSSTTFTVTPSHPLVSFLVRIIPSPDWFLGANGINLCENNNWKESYNLDLFPWDAGTDSGFTFSSPNFATNPQETISQITAKHPSHPANSFYYPRLETLPRMGHSEFVLLPTVLPSQAPDKGLEQIEPTPGTTQNWTELPQINWTYTEGGTMVEVGLKAEDVVNDVLEKPLGKEPRNSQEKKFTRTPLDCEVSAWSPWGLCSHSCGIGIRERTRFIIQHPANDGEICPSLLTQEECKRSPCQTLSADINISVLDPAEATAMSFSEPKLNEGTDSSSLEEPLSQHNETDDIIAPSHPDDMQVQESEQLLKFTNENQWISKAGVQFNESMPAFQNASGDQSFN
ncbi:spondin-2-like [Stegostoma tigrinum]|uniref:spondin-2-like n=1 Tax=Stegostoma tigrinum TaxID=3053191 RepID=UPI00202AE21B|nr:spondin-2-like [Stegostoma tigrinum]